MTYKEEPAIRLQRAKTRASSELKLELDEFLVRAKNHAELVIEAELDRNLKGKEAALDDRNVVRKAVLAALSTISLGEVGNQIEATDSSKAGILSSS